MKILVTSIFLLLCLNPSSRADVLNNQSSSTVKSLKNVAYRHHAKQMMDVYFPSKPLADQKNAPLMVMVHGGAWSIGDKNNTAVIKNIVDYWGQRGWIFISIN